jgi:hypothetical protein
MGITSIKNAATAIIFFFIAALAHSAPPVKYTCKDTNGDWTEEACPNYQKPIDTTLSKSWEPTIGMTAEAITKAITAPECFSTIGRKWCGYHKVNTTRSARGTREQWVWVNVHGMPIWYLYFDNDVLTTIQE